MNKAVDFVHAKVDEFGWKVFGREMRIGEAPESLPLRTTDEIKQARKSGTGSKFQDVFDLADNYNLSDDTFNNHMLDRHGPNSAYGNKSHFNTNFDIREGIDSTLKGENFVVGPNTAGR